MKQDKYILKRCQKFLPFCRDFHPREGYLHTRLSLRKQKLNDLWDSTRFCYSLRKENMTENKELSESDMTIQELYKIMIEDDSSLISNLNNDSFFNEISIILDYSSNPKDKEQTIVILTNLISKYPHFYVRMIKDKFLYSLKNLFTCESLAEKVTKLANNLVINNNEAIEALCHHDLFREMFEYSCTKSKEHSSEYCVSSLKMIFHIISFEKLEEIYLLACLEITLSYLKNPFMYSSCFDIIKIISERKCLKAREIMLKNKYFKGIFEFGIDLLKVDSLKFSFINVVLNILREKSLIQELIDMNVLFFLKEFLREKNRGVVNLAAFSVSLILDEFPNKIYEDHELISIIIEKVRNNTNELNETLITLCDIIRELKDFQLLRKILLKDNVIDVLFNKLNPKWINDNILIYTLETIKEILTAVKNEKLDDGSLFDKKSSQQILENLISQNEKNYEIVNEILQYFFNEDENNDYN